MNGKFEEAVVENIRVYDIPVTEGVLSAFKNVGGKLRKKVTNFSRGVEDYNQRVKAGGEGAVANLLFGKTEETFLDALDRASKACEKEFVWKDRVYPVPQKDLQRIGCNSTSKPPPATQPSPVSTGSPPRTPASPPGPGRPPQVPSSPASSGPGPAPTVPPLPESSEILPMNKFDKTIRKGSRAYVFEQGPEGVPLDSAPLPDPSALPPEVPPSPEEIEAPMEDAPEEEETDVMILGMKLIELARDALLYKGEIDSGALSQLGSTITKDNADTIEDIISGIVNMNDNVEADPTVDYSKTL